MIGDHNHGGFFAFTIAAAIAALAYAGYRNVQALGTGDGIAVTIIESVFTPVVLAAAVLYYFRHDLIRSIAPGVSSGGSRSSAPTPNRSFNMQPSAPKQIGNAVRRGGFIIIRDEKGIEIGAIGVRPDDELKGYTSSTVNVKQGGFINFYNSKGSRVGGTRAN